ncbi:DUF4956 domain-containing protein [Dactylosporangium sp. NPDC005572]|uniref:DUF4956 domain-containing protein n=1 Tax=Dactylosporangium sp. NPDC005572 TaxID=3156889 RepID=UPI0033AE760E
MDDLLIIGVDLLAIAVLTFGVYFPRHRRKDLVTAYLAVNVGVLGTTMVLGASSVGAGLGLGLFGVLSIIRLRSAEIAQHEIAYYFGALALGLLSGLTPALGGLTAALLVLIVTALYVGDHPRLFGRHRQQTMLLDTAQTDETAVRAELERRLGGRVVSLTIRHVDLVNDTTLIDVRYLAATV